MLEQITPIVLTFNEEPNIARTLSALAWAKEVIVIDSGSTDETLNICSKFDNTRVVYRSFDQFSNQSNFALKQNISTEWVLSMDADYVLTHKLITELERLKPPTQIKGYQIAFQYFISGKRLRGSLYPPRTVLYRKKSAHYQQDGHTQKVVIEGSVGQLTEKIQHDDRKPFKRWLTSQWKYAKQEANKLSVTSWGKLTLPDKFRKTGIAPLIILPYTLVLKGLIFSGVPGLIYAGQRFVAEAYLQFARLNKLRSKRN